MGERYKAAREITITRSAIVLFISGLVIEFVGFMSSHAEDFPFAMAVVSPSYSAVLSALTQLQSGSDIAPYDEGFNQLREIILEPLRQVNPPEALTTIELLRIMPIKPKATVRIVGLPLRQELGVSAVFSNKQEIKYGLSSLRSRIDLIKKEDLLRWGIGIFGLGIFMQIIGFLVEWRASARRAAFYDDSPVKPSSS